MNKILGPPGPPTLIARMKKKNHVLILAAWHWHFQ